MAASLVLFSVLFSGPGSPGAAGAMVAMGGGGVGVPWSLLGSCLSSCPLEIVETVRTEKRNIKTMKRGRVCAEITELHF